MLALSHQHNLSKYTICIVAALSVQEVLIETLDMEGPTKSKWLQKRRYWAGTGNSLLLGIVISKLFFIIIIYDEYKR